MEHGGLEGTSQSWGTFTKISLAQSKHTKIFLASYIRFCMIKQSAATTKIGAIQSHFPEQ
jgi:hypothetical protein